MDRFAPQLELDPIRALRPGYGAPIGLRLALLAPERMTALIVQNGNAYEEGLSKDWDPLNAYWRDPSLAQVFANLYRRSRRFIPKSSPLDNA